MSASLVGSEMCIRDSLVGSLQALAEEACRRQRGVRARRRAWPRVHAVSYTHLTLPTICSV
eukprot:11132831-Alexandrium_andersonii.AAC.1